MKKTKIRLKSFGLPREYGTSKRPNDTGSLPQWGINPQAIAPSARATRCNGK